MLVKSVAVPQAASRQRFASKPAAGRAPLHVVASASGAGPVPPDPKVPPPGYSQGVPVPPVYLRTPAPASGAGGPTTPGGTGGAGGYGGNRPVGTGGSGGSSSGGSGLPSGWTWDKVLLTLLGIGLAIPAWQYINRRYLFKPEPEHTAAKAEDAGLTQKLKHPIKALKHSEPARSVQHKVEDVKDNVDIGTYTGTAKAERGVEHAKKDVKHAVDDVKVKGGDVASNVDTKSHEGGVKGSRTLQRVKEKVADATWEAEEAVAKGSKGVLEGIKGAATTVGRKLHVVGDNVEKGGKKAARKAEHEVDDADNRTWWYVGSGVAVGTGVLAALYFWDRSGGDIKGKVRKLSDTAAGKAREAKDAIKDMTRNTAADAPAGPRQV